MDTNGLIETFGKIAGIGGLALGICMVVFQDIIAKNVFTSLSKRQSYELLRLVAILTFALGVSGIGAWAYSNYVVVVPPPPVWPTNFEDVRSVELVTSDVDDELQIAVNDGALKSVEFGEAIGPINITSMIHRGANKLTFTVLNGQFGGCGASIEIHLNGHRSDDYSWHWFKDIDKACANCDCFTFNKTLYLQ